MARQTFASFEAFFDAFRFANMRPMVLGPAGENWALSTLVLSNLSIQWGQAEAKAVVEGRIPIGSTGLTLPASSLPYYSVHAVGGQLNYILPAKNFSLFFKYYSEYAAYSHTIGSTVVFGGAWTLLIPKAKPAATATPKS